MIYYPYTYTRTGNSTYIRRKRCVWWSADLNRKNGSFLFAYFAET
jgi:hypothetical protein